MKKLLATILAVVMVVSSGVANLFTSNAAGPEMTKGLQLNDIGYGYVSDLGATGESGYEIEFDLWLSTAESGIQFWADTGSTRYTVTGTYVGTNRSGSGSVYTADDYKNYAWGDTGYTSDNHRHVKFEFGVNGSDNIWIDGEEVYHSGRTAGSYFSNCLILNTLGDSCVIDNFRITGNSTLDFENGSAGYLSGLLGESAAVVDVYVSIPKTEQTKGLKLDTGYAYFNTPSSVGQRGYSVEFDLWLLADDAGIQFWADYASSRLTVTKTYVGMDSSCKETYVTTDFTEYDWGETGATSDNHHHVKFEFCVDGSDNIWIDGEEVYHSGRTCNEYWCEPDHDGISHIFNTLGGTGVVVDNFKMTNNATLNFENGSAGYLSDVSTEIVDVYLTIADDGPELTQAYMLDTGYAYFNTPSSVGQRGYSVEFDLWLLADDAGIQFWADYASSRLTVTKTYVGMDSSCKETYVTTDFTEYDWGETGATSDNWHHVKFEFCVGGSDNIWIDGKEVYHSGRTCNEYWCEPDHDGVSHIFNTLGGTGVLVDNFTMTNNSLIDFEDGDPKYLKDAGGTVVDAVIKASGEIACPHISTEIVREVEPTCQKTGLDAEYCKECGERLGETVVGTVDHKWPGKYQHSDYKAATDRNDGYQAWACTYGCGTTVKASIPAKDKYTGTITNYYDFNDSTASLKVLDIFSGGDYKVVVADGVAHLVDNNGLVYWQNNATEINNPADYSITFDFKYNSTFDDNDTANHGHTLYFWFGGALNMDNMIGYNFETHEFYLTTTAVSEDYITINNDAVNIEDGAWHTISLRVFVETYDKAMDGEHAFDDEYYYVALNVDGVDVIYVGHDFFSVTNLATEKTYTIMRDFGVNCDIDNYVTGTADFRWLGEDEMPLYGDANGDGVINLADSRYLKLYNAGVIDTINTKLADVNGDGKVNAQDVVALKTVLAG